MHIKGKINIKGNGILFYNKNLISSEKYFVSDRKNFVSSEINFCFWWKNFVLNNNNLTDKNILVKNIIICFYKSEIINEAHIYSYKFLSKRNFEK